MDFTYTSWSNDIQYRVWFWYSSVSSTPHCSVKVWHADHKRITAERFDNEPIQKISVEGKTAVELVRQHIQKLQDYTTLHDDVQVRP